jgi:hypothetical protein
LAESDDINLGVVAAVGARQVPVPRARRPPETSGDGIVHLVELLPGIEAVEERIDGDAGRGDAGDLGRRPVVFVVLRLLVAVVAEGIELDAVAQLVG